MSEKLWATASAVTAAAPTADSTLAFETLKVNGAPHPEPATYANKFSGKYQHRTIKGASAIICRRPSLKPSSTLPKSDRTTET